MQADSSLDVSAFTTVQMPNRNSSSTGQYSIIGGGSRQFI
jgi:hypothetical protein